MQITDILKEKKGDNMKKIWSLLALLLLLMILCVCNKYESIHLTKKNRLHVTTASGIIEKPHVINYKITQKNDTYILSGNFKNTQQQNALSDTFSAAGAILGYKGTSTNATLVGDEVIALTQSILPHFIANYSNGQIRYQNEILHVSGDVRGYEAKHTMQRLLNATTIPTQNDTNVILDKPIDFTIMKDNTLRISGTFTDSGQVQSLTNYLRPTYTVGNIQKGSRYKDKGGIALAQTVLPYFVNHYTSGKIIYQNGIFIIEGMVESQENLDEINRLLAKTKMPVKNLTTIDPEALKRAEEAKKAEVDSMAQSLAVKEEAEQTEQVLQAQKKQAQADAENTAVKAKEEAQAAKAKIVKLLKIENIEFEVAKGTLTPKGQATVDKLATILSKYPHIKAEIAGHTDSDGSAILNQKLSQERVDTVKNRLVSKGISAIRLTAKGYGESQPLVPNTTDENKQKNRRVEINIQGE